MHRLLFFLLIFLSLFTDITVKDINAKNIITFPVNNKTIIRANEEKNRNINLDQEREILESYYELQIGSIGDEFVIFKDSPEYIESISHGRAKTVTRKEIERLRKEQLMQSESSQWQQYFVMQKRVLAPTIK